MHFFNSPTVTGFLALLAGVMLVCRHGASFEESDPVQGIKYGAPGTQE